MFTALNENNSIENNEIIETKFSITKLYKKTRAKIILAFAWSFLLGSPKVKSQVNLPINPDENYVEMTSKEFVSFLKQKADTVWLDTTDENIQYKLVPKNDLQDTLTISRAISGKNINCPSKKYQRYLNRKIRWAKKQVNLTNRESEYFTKKRNESVIFVEYDEMDDMWNTSKIKEIYSKNRRPLWIYQSTSDTNHIWTLIPRDKKWSCENKELLMWSVTLDRVIAEKMFILWSRYKNTKKIKMKMDRIIWSQ